MRLALAAMAALLAVAGGARAAGVETVKDWLGVCDNVRHCAAYGFSPDHADDAYLIIRRAGGPEAPPRVEVVVDPGDAQPSAAWTLTLDGGPIPGVGALRARGGASGARAALSGAAAMALIDALRNGRSLGVASGGKPLAAISLAGAAGVLLWVDDQQGRVGTVTALARKGPNPASAVPAPPPPPLIAAAPPVPQTGLPTRAPRSLIKGDRDCDLAADVQPDDIVARLAPGLVLWGPECSMAVYNELSIFYVGDEHAGHLKRLDFVEAPGAETPNDDSLMNVRFDARTQTLSSFAKDRGLADCGAIAAWTWTGAGFRLSAERAMPACRGVAPEDWPSLFVSRRK